MFVAAIIVAGCVSAAQDDPAVLPVLTDTATVEYTQMPALTLTVTSTPTATTTYGYTNNYLYFYANGNEHF